jgi:Gpi18-like mannosyltransferase
MEFLRATWAGRWLTPYLAHTHSGKLLARPGFALLALAALVRLALAPLPAGYFQDLQLYVNWGMLFQRHALDFYSVGAHVVPQPNYPPLTIYLYGLLTWIASGWCQITATSCALRIDSGPVLSIFMKLPTLAAEVALTGVIYSLARRYHSERAAVLFAAAYAFSPMALLDGPLWGQLDALATLGLVLALLAATRHRALAAGALLGLAVMIKPQPVVFAPVLVIYLWRQGGWRQALRGMGGMAGAVAIVCAPYLLPPRFEVLRFWHDTAQIIQALPNSTVSGFNLWWLVGAQRVPFSAPYIGPLSTNLVGWGLFALILLYALVRLWREPTPRQLWLGAALVGVAFFTLTTLQHERYLYPAVVLFLVAAIYERRAWLLYALSSLTAFANMAIILIDPAVSTSGLDVPGWRIYLQQRPAAAVGIALLNLALLTSAALLVRGAPDAGEHVRSPAAHGTDGDRPTIAAALTHAGAIRADGSRAAVTMRRDAGQGLDKDSGVHMDAQTTGIAARLHRLQAWAVTAEGRQLLSLLALATLIRLIMLPYRGFFDDVQAFVNWGFFFDQHPLHFYSLGTQVRPVPDYPPLAMYLFGVLTALVSSLYGLLGKPVPLHVDYSHALPMVFKFPIVLADLALVVAIYLVARRRLSPRGALLASATYALSPVVIFTGALWGQIDSIFILFLALALLATWAGRGATAGALFALSVMIKPQPVIFAPLLLLYLWRWKGQRATIRALAGMAIVTFIICLPYLLPPHVELLAFQRDLARWQHDVPYTSVSAFNLWWLLGAQKLPYTAPYLGPFSPNLLGWGLFFGVLAATLAGIWRSAAPSHLFFSAGLLATAFFLLTPLQHERYLLPAVAIFLLAAIFDARYWIIYGLVTLVALLNAVLVIIDPVFSDSKIPYSWTVGRHLLKTHPQVLTGLAAFNVALLVGLLALYGREVLARGYARAASAATRPLRAVPAPARPDNAQVPGAPAMVAGMGAPSGTTGSHQALRQETLASDARHRPRGRATRRPRRIPQA